MKTITTAQEMYLALQSERRQGHSVGFVPTMGALHAGHISLVEASVRENACTAVSIFVNPTQFGPAEDLSRYPRTLDADTRMLKNAGCDYLFLPSVEEMYPPGASSWVSVEGLDQHLCGLSRPGHFRGVTTIVAKLFHIVRPDRAYFGQKDYQQARILQKMNRDLDFFIDLKIMPIVREADGLALSSRNRYLDHSQRQQALVLYRCLELARRTARDYRQNVPGLLSMLRAFVRSEAPQARIDYISLVDPESLEDVDRLQGSALLALAVFIGNTRLIDNTLLEA